MARSVSPPARRAAQAIWVTAGRMTSPSRMLPGFLIIGAQRCGTTSMYRALSQHPAVLKAVLHKGVHYFDMNYDRGLAWYKAHFPSLASGRRAGLAAGTTALTFESSPYYLFHPLAADRIAKDLPGVRLLVLVRDPVERAYSAYAHERARGFEGESFERALELESQRLAGEAERIAAEPAYVSHSHQHHAYRARGQYSEQLTRLDRLFGRKRLHVVDSGDFFTEPEPVYDAVLDFLGLGRHGYPEFEPHNARLRSPMPASLRAQLEDHFLPFDEQLTAWLGQTPSWRR
jgi:Sulfotransferase domain